MRLKYIHGIRILEHGIRILEHCPLESGRASVPGAGWKALNGCGVRARGRDLVSEIMGAGVDISARQLLVSES
jgi:hypothetical protein